MEERVVADEALHGLSACSISCPASLRHLVYQVMNRAPCTKTRSGFLTHPARPVPLARTGTLPLSLLPLTCPSHRGTC